MLCLNARFTIVVFGSTKVALEIQKIESRACAFHSTRLSFSGWGVVSYRHKVATLYILSIQFSGRYALQSAHKPIRLHNLWQRSTDWLQSIVFLWLNICLYSEFVLLNRAFFLREISSFFAKWWRAFLRRRIFLYFDWLWFCFKFCFLKVSLHLFLCVVLFRTCPPKFPNLVSGFCWKILIPTTTINAVARLI